METFELLTALTQATGVSGEEDHVLSVAAELVKDLGETSISTLKSLICKVKVADPSKPHIMLNAHIDEIGMLVRGIDKNGFAKIARVGGIDRRMIMSSPVIAHTEEGEFYGVVGSTPPHLIKGEKKNPTLDEVYVDFGFDSKEECENHIPIGTILTFEGEMVELKNGLAASKAMDDRCCCASLIQACRLLKDMDTDCSITLMLSSMEEVGGQGAQTATYGIDPTHAIVMDVTFGSAPDMSKEKFAPIGGGPTLSGNGAQDSIMAKQLMATAKKHNLPFSLEPSGGNGVSGTDAAGVVNRRAGVRTVVMGLPLRNMHTPVEVLSVADLDNSAKLIAEFVAEYIR